MVVPLYRKHGWPSDDSDGDAFLKDLEAAREAQQRDWTEEESRCGNNISQQTAWGAQQTMQETE
jgi:hypothetical protein